MTCCFPWQLWIRLCGFCPSSAFHDEFDTKVKQLKRSRRNESVVPLSLSRRRNLSLSEPLRGDDVPSSTIYATNAQEKCVLFRLPWELLLKIYEDILGSQSIHVVTMHRRLGAFPCEDENSLTENRPCRCFSREATRVGNAAHGVLGLGTYDKTGIGVLPVLSTCKRMYDTVCHPTTFSKYIPV
jgi:hypothetical protein